MFKNHKLLWIITVFFYSKGLFFFLLKLYTFKQYLSQGVSVIYYNSFTIKITLKMEVMR